MCPENFENYSTIKLRVKVQKVRKNCTQQLYNADLGLSVWPLPMTPAKVGRRSVLDSIKYEPGNRPYWEMKEGRIQSQYPDLIRALRSEPDPSRRRQIVNQHWAQIIGLRRGTIWKNIVSQWYVWGGVNIGEVKEPVRSTKNVRNDRNASNIWNTLMRSDMAEQSGVT